MVRLTPSAGWAMSLTAKLEGGIPWLGGSCSLHLEHLANSQLLLMLKIVYFGFNV